MRCAHAARCHGITDVELILSDAYVGAPPVPTEALTDDNRGGLSVAAPVVAGGTVAISGLEDPGLSYVWLFSSPHGLGYAQAAGDGTLQVTIPTGVAAGPHRLAVTTPGGWLLGWTDLTVTAAATGPGAVPADPPPATPGSGAGAAPATTPVRAGTDVAEARQGGLAATGSDVGWMAGAALATLLLGGGLVVLRGRRMA